MADNNQTKKTDFSLSKYDVLRNYDSKKIPKDIFKLCMALINHPKFEYEFRNEGANDKKIHLASSFKSVCYTTNEDGTFKHIPPIVDQIAREIVDSEGKPITNTKWLTSLSESTFNFSDLTGCWRCHHSACPKQILGYILYKKEMGELDQLIEEQKTNTLEFFDYVWEPADGLKHVSEPIFQLAQKIIELNGIDLPRTSKKKKTIDISLWYKCKDLRELQSADELKNVQQIKNAKGRTIITCDLSEPLTKINDCGFVCCQHTCAFKVAGYLYYLKYTCQEEKIFADRQYYKEHEQEILTKIENDYIAAKASPVISEEQNKTIQLFAEYQDSITNLDQLINNIHNPSMNYMYCAFEKEDGISLQDILTHVSTRLTDLRKIDNSITKSIVSTIHELASITNKEGNPISIYSLKPQTLYILNGIDEFLKTWDKIANTGYFYHSEMRLHQVNTLIENISTLAENRYIILVGTEAELSALYSKFPRIKSVFSSTHLVVSNMSTDKLFSYYKQGLIGSVYDKVSSSIEESKKKFSAWLETNRSLSPFKNKELADYLSAYSNSKNDVEFPPDIYRKQTLEESLSEIVGLDEIKEKIKKFEQYITFSNKANAKGIKVPATNMHMLFTGNPGCGKTTIARIMARLLYDIGVLKENKLIEVDRKDLIAEYIGQTAPKTNEVINKAMGGVLFIDEAYSLTPKDSTKDFGQEAIATIIKAMEDRKGEFVVIFAGYKKEMRDFVASNSGIASRIGYTFDFEDYDNDELLEIVKLKVAKTKLKLDDSAIEPLSLLISFFSNVENSGNGRLADRIVQETLVKHASRECAEDEFEIICDKDIPTVPEMTKIIYATDSFIDPTKISEDALKRTAYHEVGHAFVRYKLFETPGIKLITINADGTGILGKVQYKDDVESYTSSKQKLMNRIATSMAGMASEEFFLEYFENGNSSDLKHATTIATNMVTKYGMSDLGFARIDDIEGEMSPVILQEVNKILKGCFEQAKAILNDNQRIIHKLVDFIIKNKEIDEKEFIAQIEKGV